MSRTKWTFYPQRLRTPTIIVKISIIFFDFLKIFEKKNFGIKTKKNPKIIFLEGWLI